MRVAELSRRSGVSVASIKYYLREGLLPPGERTGPNQARYTEDHIRRLRLVRALLDVGGLSVAGAREILGAVDSDDIPLHEVLGVTQVAVTPVPARTDDAARSRAATTVDDLVTRRGWRVSRGNPGRRAAVEILATWDRLHHGPDPAGLDVQAQAAENVARHEVRSVGGGAPREQTVESSVLGMVLGGSLLTALRAMAQESASAEVLGVPLATASGPAEAADGG